MVPAQTESSSTRRCTRRRRRRPAVTTEIALTGVRYVRAVVGVIAHTVAVSIDRMGYQATQDSLLGLLVTLTWLVTSASSRRRRSGRFGRC